MAKFPRSKRKSFQIQRGQGQEGFSTESCFYIIPNANWEVWGITSENKWGRIAIAETKKQASQYIAKRRKAIKNREW